MQRLWQFLLDARVLAVIGLLALAAFLFIGADAAKVGAAWAGAILLMFVVAWCVAWGIRWRKVRRAGQRLEAAIDAESRRAVTAAPNRELQAELASVRKRINKAVKTIKSSKLGQYSGASALYQLPWYAVIGNPAAGKSSAVVGSGLPHATSENQVDLSLYAVRWMFSVFVEASAVRG